MALPDRQASRLQPGHRVRDEKREEHEHDCEHEIAVDVLSMIKEASVDHFVDRDDDEGDQYPDAPVGDQMSTHVAKHSRWEVNLQGQWVPDTDVTNCRLAPTASLPARSAACAGLSSPTARSGRERCQGLRQPRCPRR